MPRTSRASLGGICYHVLNRGNARMRIFAGEDDYLGFIELLQLANERLPMRLLTACLMPNHFHLVLWPHKDGDLSRWMQWLLTSHVRRYHKRRGPESSGHVWQGRFRAFPIQSDDHLFTVMRYVERNPVRAKLVRRAERWRWSRIWAGQPGHPAGLFSPPPLALPRNWLERVNRPETAAELAALQRSAHRGTPFGAPEWATRTAAKLGLESSLNPRGRPRLTEEETK